MVFSGIFALSKVLGELLPLLVVSADTSSEHGVSLCLVILDCNLFHGALCARVSRTWVSNNALLQLLLTKIKLPWQ